MGRAVAVELASSGCVVALCANDAAGLSSAADEIANGGGVASALNVDVTDQGALSAAIDGVAREWGRVDHLVTAAGREGKYSARRGPRAERRRSRMSCGWTAPETDDAGAAMSLLPDQMRVSFA